VLTLSTISQKKKEAKKKNHYYNYSVNYNSDLNLKVTRGRQRKHRIILPK
jgi:hypothetical protein